MKWRGWYREEIPLAEVMRILRSVPPGSWRWKPYIKVSFGGRALAAYALWCAVRTAATKGRDVSDGGWVPDWVPVDPEPIITFGKVPDDPAEWERIYDLLHGDPLERLYLGEVLPPRADAPSAVGEAEGHSPGVGRGSAQGGPQ